MRSGAFVPDIILYQYNKKNATLSRFFNRMDDDTLDQFNRINARLRKRIYSIQKPECLLLDLDSTLLPTYGMQEGGAFNFHGGTAAIPGHPVLLWAWPYGKLHQGEQRRF